MKRIAALALTFLFATAVFGEGTERYLVATKHPFRNGLMAGSLRELRAGIAPREVAPLDSFTGFAADLTADEVSELRRSPDVRWIEPVVERHALALSTRNPDVQTVPWGIDAIHAREAAAGTSAGDVNVAVIDTGIDYLHPELAAAWFGGYDFVNNDGDPRDDNGHGTHVSGTIAAADNATGVLGVAPKVHLWSLKVLDSAGSGTSESVLKALDWVRAKKQSIGGNWVVSLSLGSHTKSAAEQEGFTRAVAEGIVVVAASGNESTAEVPSPVGYPAAYPGVIAVGAVDSTAAIADFSDQGPELAYVAPGVGVLSTLRMGTGTLSRVIDGGSSFPAAALDGSRIGSITGAYVYCGLGKPEDFPPSVKGKIALIRRGELTFADKTKNAKIAGALAVVIFNNDSSAMNWTLLSATDPTSATYPWPVTVGITLENGEALVAQAGGTITAENQHDDYGELSGTSMATPHVSAAIALLWSLAPSATPEQLFTALTQTATDLGVAGQDNVYGHGLINVFEAAKLVAPNAFQHVPTSGRRILRRGHH